jgi:hypothetical protein
MFLHLVVVTSTTIKLIYTIATYTTQSQRRTCAAGKIEEGHTDERPGRCSSHGVSWPNYVVSELH